LAFDPLDLRFGLSILLMATMIGTPAALRVVDGFLRLRHHASSARTTKTTMSVTFGARGCALRVKASWPRIHEHDFAAVE